MSVSAHPSAPIYPQNMSYISSPQAAAAAAAAQAAHQQFLAAQAAAQMAQQQQQQQQATASPTSPTSGMACNSAGAPVTVNSAALFNVSTILNQKDSRWLQLEVCREFQRNKCSRADNECKFAHPAENIEVQNGRVTACYDSIKGRCNRDKPPCKYFHPPQHLKDQLLINGRNHLALKNAVLQQYGLVGQPIIPGQVTSPVPSPYMSALQPQMAAAYPAAAATTAFHLPGTAHMVPIIHPADQALLAAISAANGQANGQVTTNATTPVSSQQHALVQQQQQHQAVLASGAAPQQPQHGKQRSDRIEVCREFVRGTCKRPSNECRFAHPLHLAFGSNSCTNFLEDGFVTICMDHEKGRCARDPCRYYHRQIETKKSSPACNQLTTTAAATASPPQQQTQHTHTNAAAISSLSQAENPNLTGKKRPRETVENDLQILVESSKTNKRSACSDKSGYPAFSPSHEQLLVQQQQQHQLALALQNNQAVMQATVAAAVANPTVAGNHNGAISTFHQQPTALLAPYVPVSYTSPAAMAMPRHQ